MRRRKRAATPVEPPAPTPKEQAKIVTAAYDDERTLGIKSCEQLGWIFDRDGDYWVASRPVGQTQRYEHKPSKDELLKAITTWELAQRGLA